MNLTRYLGEQAHRIAELEQEVGRLLAIVDDRQQTVRLRDYSLELSARRIAHLARVLGDIASLPPTAQLEAAIEAAQDALDSL